MEKKIFDTLSEQYKDYNLPIVNNDLGINPVYVFHTGCLFVKNTLEECLSQRAWVSLNYHIHSKYIDKDYPNGKPVNKDIIEGDLLAYSMEEVLESLYYFPETFRVDEEHKDDFSKNEIRFLNKIQSYLLFIGLKDITLDTDMDERCKNETIKKYKGYENVDHSNYFIDKLIKGDIDFTVYREWRKFDKDCTFEDKQLVFDDEGHVRLAMEETTAECKLYKDVKDDIDDIYKDKFKDDDKLLVVHYKVLEVFDK